MGAQSTNCGLTLKDPVRSAAFLFSTAVDMNFMSSGFFQNRIFFSEESVELTFHAIMAAKLFFASVYRAQFTSYVPGFPPPED